MLMPKVGNFEIPKVSIVENLGCMNFTCMEQELLILPEHLISPPVFSRVRVAQSLVFCVICFVDRCLFFWPLCSLVPPLVSSNVSQINIFRIGIF